MSVFQQLQMYLSMPFVQYALIVGTLIALCSSLLGVTLVLKRFSFIGDGLSHVAFGAMAIAGVLRLTNEMLFVLPVTVYPPKEGETGNSLRLLTGLIDTADLNQVSKGSLELPDTVGDVRLSYHMRRDLTGLKILLCGILAAALLGFRPAQEKKIAAKKRETELLLDYAEVVSRLIVYLGAGMTIRNAWGKITKEYEEAKAAGRTEKRNAYEEMIQTALELEKGVSERRAYIDFAHRCGPRCYLRLASILEQNLRTGDKRLAAALELEIQEAFEQRRNAARRLGEEAGTKLVIPLVLSLLAVMMTVTMPALLTMM